MESGARRGLRHGGSPGRDVSHGHVAPHPQDASSASASASASSPPPPVKTAWKTAAARKLLPLSLTMKKLNVEIIKCDWQLPKEKLLLLPPKQVEKEEEEEADCCGRGDGGWGDEWMVGRGGEGCGRGRGWMGWDGGKDRKIVRYIQWSDMTGHNLHIHSNFHHPQEKTTSTLVCLYRGDLKLSGFTLPY